MMKMVAQEVRAGIILLSTVVIVYGSYYIRTLMAAGGKCQTLLKDADFIDILDVVTLGYIVQSLIMAGRVLSNSPQVIQAKTSYLGYKISYVTSSTRTAGVLEPQFMRGWFSKMNPNPNDPSAEEGQTLAFEPGTALLWLVQVFLYGYISVTTMEEKNKPGEEGKTQNLLGAVQHSDCRDADGNWGFLTAETAVWYAAMGFMGLVVYEFVLLIMGVFTWWSYNWHLVHEDVASTLRYPALPTQLDGTGWVRFFQGHIYVSYAVLFGFASTVVYGSLGSSYCNVALALDAQVVFIIATTLLVQGTIGSTGPRKETSGEIIDKVEKKVSSKQPRPGKTEQGLMLQVETQLNETRGAKIKSRRFYHVALIAIAMAHIANIFTAADEKCTDDSNLEPGLYTASKGMAYAILAAVVGIFGRAVARYFTDPTRNSTVVPARPAVASTQESMDSKNLSPSTGIYTRLTTDSSRSQESSLKFV